MSSLSINFCDKYNDRYNLYFSFVYHTRTISELLVMEILNNKKNLSKLFSVKKG